MFHTQSFDNRRHTGAASPSWAASRTPKTAACGLHRYQGCLRFCGPSGSVESTSCHWSSTLPDSAHPGSAHRHNFTSSSREEAKHLTLPRGCAKDVFLRLHYFVWQLTGSCPDVPTVSALLSDLDYADHAVLFAQDPGRWHAELESFDDAATTTGLHILWILWVKTKLQNVGYVPPPQSVSCGGYWQVCLFGQHCLT